MFRAEGWVAQYRHAALVNGRCAGGDQKTGGDQSTGCLHKVNIASSDYFEGTYGLRDGDGLIAGLEELKDFLDQGTETRRGKFTHVVMRGPRR